MMPEEFPQFIKNNRKYIEEAYMTKQPIKSPLTEYCLSKLKEQGQISQHTTMETLFPPKSDLRGVPRPRTSLPSYRRVPWLPFYSECFRLPTAGANTKDECKSSQTTRKQSEGDLRQKMILSGIIKVDPANDKATCDEN